MRSPWTLIRAAVLAGLIAGGVAAAFHLLVTERLIDRAIQHEAEERRSAGGAAPAPVVSRAVQKIGLVIGLLAYGAVVGVLVAVGCEVVERWFPGVAQTGRGWLLALLGGWSVSVFPFLKYPANPPGVGAPQTIGHRQTLYFGFLVLSIIGIVAVASLTQIMLGRGGAVGAARAWLVAAGLYVAYAVALYTLMPANPDAVRMPSEIVWGFRLASLAGLGLFWATLGGVFGRLAHGQTHG